MAGIEYTIDTRVPYENGRQYPGSTYFAPKNLGSRVQITSVGGKPFDLDATYHVVTVEFVTRGGDAYGHCVEPCAIESTSIGYADKEAIVNYLKEALNGVVPESYREAQGRITLLK